MDEIARLTETQASLAARETSAQTELIRILQYNCCHDCYYDCCQLLFFLAMLLLLLLLYVVMI